MKLELKHLASYLPYGLIVQWIREDDKTIIMSDLNISDYNFLIKYKRAKPILRPLSNLTKVIKVNGEKFMPSVVLSESDSTKCGYTWNYYAININNVDIMNYEIVQQLLQWHFDIYGLIENGLAIDINTLES